MISFLSLFGGDTILISIVAIDGVDLHIPLGIYPIDTTSFIIMISTLSNLQTFLTIYSHTQPNIAIMRPIIKRLFCQLLGPPCRHGVVGLFNNFGGAMDLSV